MILGIDEVGRGPWAGPLVMGAVVLGGASIDGLTDSKKLTKKRREALYDEIYATAAAVGLGWVNAEEIDQIGLSAALKQATARAVREVQAAKVPFQEIIIDGTSNFLAETSLESYVTTMKKADLLIPSVSAASIVAKVARDRYMAEQDSVYPGYGFASHVGYGTAAHREAIERIGVTPLHRLSFAPLAKYRQSPLPSSKNLTDFSRRSPDADLSDTTRLQQSGSQTTRQIGDSSEQVASQELVRRGHRIIERNWKTKYCEIDIISKKEQVMYFTEVKHRRNAKSGDGLAAITSKKLNQMKFAAKLYAHSQHIDGVDLRLIAIATTGDDPQIETVTLID